MDKPITALRQEYVAAASVLVHDCGNAERCYCFGVEDVARYRRARAAYIAMLNDQAEVAL